LRAVILAVGRGRAGPERALYEDYARRLREAPELIEVEDKRKTDTATRVAREAELLRARIPAGAVTVALDGSGRMLSSEDLAARVQTWRESAVPAVAFIIGGADGLAREIVAKADLVLSLGPMTWPHMLVRTLLAEQIYRAEAILAGHPYHRAGPPPERG
jgi:23S rRNA (pseudouridine1915-N3)-methyltransferase